MSDEELREWMKIKDLSPTEAAAILGIAYPTLQTFLRGARPGDETAQRMKERVSQYNSKNPTRKKSGAA
jgi:hypothetical protein